MHGNLPPTQKFLALSIGVHFQEQANHVAAYDIICCAYYAQRLLFPDFSLLERASSQT